MDRAALINLAYKAEQKYGLPKGMLVAQLHQESSDGTNTANPEGPVGAMQIQPATAAQYGIADPTDPAQAIDGAGKIMADKLKSSGGDVAHALKLYYAGSEKGIGPRSNAYPGQVGSKWSMNDLVDDAVSPTAAPTPASADPAPAAAPPAMSDLVDDATGHSTASTATPSASAPPATPDAPTDPYVDLKAALQNVVNHHGSPDDVAETAKAMGYDPSTFENLKANVQSGHITYGADFHPQKIDPNALNSFGNRAAAALQSVPASANRFAAFMDENVPALNALDGLVGMSPDKFRDQANIQSAISQAAQKIYPGAAGMAGNIAGSVLGTAPFIVPAMATMPEAGLGGFLAGRTGGNLLTRAASMSAGGATGGAMGGALTFGDSTDSPLAHIGSMAAGGAVLGPVFGAAGGPISRIVGSGANALEDAVGPLAARAIPGYSFVPSIDRNASNLIAQRVGQDASAGGPSAADLQASAVPGKPLTLMDVGGENVRALAGRIVRSPGPARQTIANFLTGRDAGAGARLESDVRGAISNQGSAYDTADALSQQRAADAAPLYEKAFQGGSTAPLETQFQDALQGSGAKAAQAQQALATAQNEATQAAAEVSRAGDNVYASNQALARQKAAQQALAGAQQDVAAAQAEHASNLGRLQQAQADGSANAPGAVWNPRIQQFLDDPIMKGGLKRGLEIQRLESVANGQPFNPREYAVTGADENGDPVVGAVPNMRLLDAGKRGLDGIINDHTDPVTGKVDEYGRAVTLFKKSYLGELDKVNPDYGPAREAYSGPSQSMDALRQGQKILNMDPAEIKAKFADLSPGDQEFFRQGAASKLLEKLAKTSKGGDESLKLSGNDWVKRQLMPLFKSPEEYAQFAQRVDAEHTMFRTKQAIIGGSDTGRRVAEDASPLDQAGHTINAFHGFSQGVAGNPLGFLQGINSLMRLSSPGINPALGQAVGNRLTAPLGQDLYSGARSAPGYLIPPALAVGVNKLRSGSAPAR